MLFVLGTEWLHESPRLKKMSPIFMFLTTGGHRWLKLWLTVPVSILACLWHRLNWADSEGHSIVIYNKTAMTVRVAIGLVVKIHCSSLRWPGLKCVNHPPYCTLTRWLFPIRDSVVTKYVYSGAVFKYNVEALDSYSHWSLFRFYIRNSIS